jgi:hypothetical protein
MDEIPNLKPDLEAERAKYPATLTHDQPAKILNAVAWQHRASGAGLSVKPGGNRVPSPQGVDVAYDIIHFRDSNRLFDAFTGDLAGKVTWSETIYHGDPVNRPWLAPIEPDGIPDEPEPDEPPPPPQPKTKTKDEIRAAIVELKRFYDEPDGLNRKARGVPSPVTVDDPAFWDWVALAVLEPIEQVKDRIRQFPEYKDNHR